MPSDPSSSPTPIANSPRVALGLHACQNVSSWDRGIARYVREHALHLVAEHSDLVRELWIDSRLPLPRKLADFCGLGILRSGGTTSSPDHTSGPPDIYHIMSPFELDKPLSVLLPKEVIRSGSLLAVTLYDLIPLRYPDFYLSDPATRAVYESRLRLIRDADLVFTISDTTAQDAVELLGVDAAKLRTLYAGVSDHFRPAPAEGMGAFKQLQAALPHIAGSYILYTGGIEFRKNLDRLIEAYSLLPAALRNSYQLVITCKVRPNDREDLLATARRHGVGDRLVVTGYVPDSLLAALYQACSLFVFPSLYEGFGLPILEAMRSGAPVICSDSSSMREILDLPEARFSPLDAASMSALMEAVLSDRRLSERLRSYSLERSAAFTWSAVAARSAAAFRSFAPATGRRGSRTQRLHIAFCTPYPPQPSGVADYSQRFLSVLVDHYPVDVSVVVEGDPRAYRQPTHPSIRLVAAPAFEASRRWEAYDYTVYCMGNSVFHRHVFELLRRYPGAVWLHDVRLTGFYRVYRDLLGTFSAGDISFQSDVLGRLRADFNSLLELSLHEQHEGSVYLTRAVAGRGHRVFVNSEFARDIVLAEMRSVVPVTVVPFAYPDPPSKPVELIDRKLLLAQHALDERTKLIVSVGIVAPTKQPELLINAVAQLREIEAPIKLVFVGECDSQYKRSLMNLAEGAGVCHRVYFTGRVDDVELRRWLSASELAVQLRFPTNGESSAAVADCLSHGLPTIVTATGPQRELADVTVQVPADIDPGLLAEEIQRLLADAHLRQGLADSAVRYARAHSFARACQRFWEAVLADLARAPAQIDSATPTHGAQG